MKSYYNKISNKNVSRVLYKADCWWFGQAHFHKGITDKAVQLYLKLWKSIKTFRTLITNLVAKRRSQERNGHVRFIGVSYLCPFNSDVRHSDISTIYNTSINSKEHVRARIRVDIQMVLRVWYEIRAAPRDKGLGHVQNPEESDFPMGVAVAALEEFIGLATLLPHLSDALDLLRAFRTKFFRGHQRVGWGHTIWERVDFRQSAGQREFTVRGVSLRVCGL